MQLYVFVNVSNTESALVLNSQCLSPYFLFGKKVYLVYLRYMGVDQSIVYCLSPPTHFKVIQRHYILYTPFGGFSILMFKLKYKLMMIIFLIPVYMTATRPNEQTIRISSRSFVKSSWLHSWGSHITRMQTLIHTRIIVIVCNFSFNMW